MQRLWVHKYMMSHTGVLVTMGTVGAYVHSIKNNLNTKISTEAGLVVVDYFLTQVICTWYFLKVQGYKIHDNIIYQDKHSAIKLDNNGRWLSSKNTSHINIRYYFITRRITKQEASLEFFPNMDMIGDYFT